MAETMCVCMSRRVYVHVCAWSGVWFIKKFTEKNERRIVRLELICQKDTKPKWKSEWRNWNERKKRGNNKRKCTHTHTNTYYIVITIINSTWKRRRKKTHTREMERMKWFWKFIQQKKYVYPMCKRAFNSLYGYTHTRTVSAFELWKLCKCFRK